MASKKGSQLVVVSFALISNGLVSALISMRPALNIRSNAYFYWER